MKEELFKLAEGIRKCVACPLWKKRTLAVPGEGFGKVMFIGESSGIEEDRLGRPFVGRSGKFLDEMLKAAGLRREKVFLTGAVKCHPPGNRNPTALELKTCRELWLEKQISIIKPKLIVVLGRIALKSLLGKRNVNELHGKVVEKDGLRYFITYHPAAGMRFPKVRELMIKDFEKLKLLKK